MVQKIHANNNSVFNITYDKFHIFLFKHKYVLKLWHFFLSALQLNNSLIFLKNNNFLLSTEIIRWLPFNVAYYAEFALY